MALRRLEPWGSKQPNVGHIYIYTYIHTLSPKGGITYILGAIGEDTREGTSLGSRVNVCCPPLRKKTHVRRTSTVTPVSSGHVIA